MELRQRKEPLSASKGSGENPHPADFVPVEVRVVWSGCRGKCLEDALLGLEDRGCGREIHERDWAARVIHGLAQYRTNGHIYEIAFISGCCLMLNGEDAIFIQRAVAD